MVTDAASPFDRIVFDGASVRIGAFRASPNHPDFADSGPIRQFCFVFPRTSVWIQHEGARPFVTDPTVITLYNRGQTYRRRSVSPEGDRCDWFAVTRELIVDAFGASDPAAADRDRVIPLAVAPSAPSIYLRQRELFNAARSRDVDALAIEEAVIHLLASVVEQVQGGRRQMRVPPARARAIAEDAKAVIAPRYSMPLTVADVAMNVGCSVFHLCRVFRRQTGLTLTDYRNQLRIRAALERLSGATRADLTALALDLGFSSHSHFTAVFRRSFGMTPSAVRKGSGRISPANYSTDGRAREGDRNRAVS